MGVVHMDTGSGNRLTLSMIVKNEENRFLEDMLRSARDYISDAIIIDDNSSDRTVEICRSLLSSVPLKIIENKESTFQNEWKLRTQQWRETIAIDPDWIIFLDADEIFEDKFKYGVKELMKNDVYDVYLFRLYDFWNSDYYRDDDLWCAHRYYRPFMMRYKKDAVYTFSELNQHCGRMPNNIFDFENIRCSYRLKHFGWARESDRIQKFNRYMKLDPQGIYGSLRQYNSILDPNPNLVKWNE